MQLKIDQSELKMKTLRALERGSIEVLYQIVRQFAYDDNGLPMDPDMAEAILDDMNTDEVQEWMETVNDAVLNAAIPPTPARNSKDGVAAKGQRHSG